ncbi:endocuticle structural protein SgAbd-6-like [Condylostylus longicornis]|uniref:endocuticle structural protein SgAbd-6-like n=1 Tax=Condylostylus longicornis TaxID=2530218 RepID=UPI00244DBB29|nr:endocuticle structural protein SgAbd-6-like [Condylostylus longicornis]
MKFIIVFAALFAVVLSAPLDSPQEAQVLKSEFDNIGVDGYKFAFETSDGTSRQEQAEVKNLGSDEEAISIRGSVSWVDADGQTYSLNYIADENGFQPQGDHIPKA